MSKRRKMLLGTLAEIAVILLLHSFLLWWLADRNVVAKLLSAGAHLPAGTVFVALLFLLVRLFAVVVLPGLVLARLVLLALPFARPASPAAPEQAADQPRPT